MAAVDGGKQRGFRVQSGRLCLAYPGYTNLSSDFGVGRWIYGKWDVHRGNGCAGPGGHAHHAAADGVVSTNNHWTYGIP